MEKIELKVEGMMCEGCVRRINNILSNIKSINKYHISLEKKTVILELEEDYALKDIIDKINDLGFKAIEND